MVHEHGPCATRQTKRVRRQPAYAVPIGASRRNTEASDRVCCAHRQSFARAPCGWAPGEHEPVTTTTKGPPWRALRVCVVRGCYQTQPVPQVRATGGTLVRSL